MSDPQTIREHLEAIRDRHVPAEQGLNECLCGDFADTCGDRKHAVAALDLLDNAARAQFDGEAMLLEVSEAIVADPDPASRGQQKGGA